MHPKTKMIGAMVGGAAVLASGAYALGAQNGGGDAQAAASARAAQQVPGPAGYGTVPGKPGKAGALRRGLCGPSGGGPAIRREGIASLAKKLGVTESKLRDALKAVRKDLAGKKPDAGTDPRDAFVTALAKELGIDKAKVEAALPKPPAGGPGRMHGGPHPDGPMGDPPSGAPGGYGTPPAPPATPQ